MWTQRDQIQAYRFLRRRLVSALVSADANHPVSPSRRLILGTVLGIVATLLATATFGILRVLKPHTGANWKQPGQVIIEKETGTRYILAGDGLLHPVLNFASARLLAGGNGSKTSTVAAKTLANVGRGTPLGIAGAPDSVPAARQLRTGPATVCTFVPAGRPAAALAQTAFRWGATLRGSPLPTTQGLLASAGADTDIVTGGYRYRVPGSGALAALGLEGLAVTKVSAAWLSAVPAGADLALMSVTGAGEPGPQIAGRNRPIGTVLKVSTANATTAYYLARSASIAPISAIQAALITANPANRKGGLDGKPATDVDPDQLARVPRSEVAAGGTGALPSLRDLPSMVRLPAASVPLCLVLTTHNPATLMLVASASSVTAHGIAPPAQPPGSLVADEIVVPASTGGLVTTSTDAGASTYLITDSGLKYPLSSPEAVTALGYGRVSPMVLSNAVLALLPTGPALDQATAQRGVAVAAK